MTSQPKRWLPAYQYLAGLSDAITGIFLILLPAWAMRTMRVATPAQPAAFTSFIGVFVLSVGLSYFLVTRNPLTTTAAAAWQMQWRITAVTRTLVALFLIISVAIGQLEPAWVLVAVSDGALAVIQWIGLARGWLAVEPPAAR